MESSPLQQFVDYCQQHIIGDEKGEAQLFLDRFFIALGYTDGLKGAGATCEFRIKNEQNRSTSFGDLVWKKRVLIEMKKRGTNLEIHLQQAHSYWLMLAGDRPRYVILCNFDAFWIYDFEVSIYKPAETIPLQNLPDRHHALGFLLPHPAKPVFGKNLQDVTGKAAEKVAEVFRSLIKRNTSREDALRFCMQCIISMFAEDSELLPDTIFTRLVKEALEKSDGKTGADIIPDSYDLIGGLFKEMNTRGISEGTKYRGVDYFNGGLFEVVKPIELTYQELNMLEAAAMQNWRNVNPAIFGSIFEAALETTERHKLGAHYTHEIDIKKIIDPCIVQPWNTRIDAAQTFEEHLVLLTELTNYTVLDPACGSGNFLFVAFRELKLLEKKLLTQVRDRFLNSKEDIRIFSDFLQDYPYVNTRQLYGYDIKPFAVELAKVTLMVAKELAWLDHREAYDNKFRPLPLDNLDTNIICCDALLDGNSQRSWVPADVIVGNPPYQARSKMLSEFGVEYLTKLYNAYPNMNKYADFCTFWFFKAHKTMKPDGFAGLVATNTIRENNSRVSSLDYIVQNGGTIFNAVSSQKWSGDAAVSVSIVNWKKGDFTTTKILYYPDSKMDLVRKDVSVINSSLSLNIDLSEKKYLHCNTNQKPVKCIMGQKHGHDGFLLERHIAQKIISKNLRNAQVLKPYLIGRELVSNLHSQPERFVIDFSQMDLVEATSYKELFKIIENKVLPQRQTDAEKQQVENKQILENNPKIKVNTSYIQYFNSWWQLIGKRPELVKTLQETQRYIVVSAVSKRNIFEFVSSEIRPNASLITFLFDDYYSFGILQSVYHFEWWKATCSTLEDRFRYTIDPVWDTFPFPQNPDIKAVRRVAKAAQALHTARTQMLNDYKISLRDLYRTLEKPGQNQLRILHTALDEAVRDAYGFQPAEILAQLLALNLLVASSPNPTPPGLPSCVDNPAEFITDNCVKML